MVMGFEAGHHGQVPGFMEFPAEFGAEDKLVVGFSPFVLRTRRPHPTIVGIEGCFPRDGILFISQFQVGSQNAHTVVVTAGSPVPLHRFGEIQIDETREGPILGLGKGICC